MGLFNANHRHYLIWLVNLLIIILTGFTLVHAEPNTPLKSDGQEIIKHVLKNGLTILIKPSSANQVVTVDAFLRMGAFYEPEGKRGISSLMQRVMTKGTTTRDAKEIAFAAESAGSTIEANLVDYSSGRVALKTTLSGLETGLGLFLDILSHPTFSEAEVAKEKQLLTRELLSNGDQPATEVYQNYLNLFYEGSPIGMSPEKITERLKDLTRSDIDQWYHRIYVPNNMVISIAGNVNPAEMIKRIEQVWGDAPQGKLPPVVKNKSLSLTVIRRVVEKRDSQALFMMLGFPAPAVSDPDYPVMQVISYILGGDMGSRLFVNLRDKRGLAYTVGTGYDPGNYPANIFAYIATAPTNYHAVKDGVLAEFRKVASESVDAIELAQAKQAICGRFMMTHETNAGQSGILGLFELNGVGYQYDKVYPDLVEKVTADDIRRVARKYFTQYTMSVVSPVDIQDK